MSLGVVPAGLELMFQHILEYLLGHDGDNCSNLRNIMLSCKKLHRLFEKDRATFIWLAFEAEFLCPCPGYRRAKKCCGESVSKWPKSAFPWWQSTVVRPGSVENLYPSYLPYLNRQESSLLGLIDQVRKEKDYNAWRSRLYPKLASIGYDWRAQRELQDSKDKSLDYLFMLGMSRCHIGHILRNSSRNTVYLQTVLAIIAVHCRLLGSCTSTTNAFDPYMVQKSLDNVVLELVESPEMQLGNLSTCDKLKVIMNKILPSEDQDMNPTLKAFLDFVRDQMHNSSHIVLNACLVYIIGSIRGQFLLVEWVFVSIHNASLVRVHEKGGDDEAEENLHFLDILTRSVLNKEAALRTIETRTNGVFGGQGKRFEYFLFELSDDLRSLIRLCTNCRFTFHYAINMTINIQHYNSILTALELDIHNIGWDELQMIKHREHNLNQDNIISSIFDVFLHGGSRIFAP